MSYPIVNNEQEQQFEVTLGEDVALLEYRFLHGNLALMHTEVPEAMEGKGIASALATHALEWARSSNKKVKVYCSYVNKFLKRHPEYNDLLV